MEKIQKSHERGSVLLNTDFEISIRPNRDGINIKQLLNCTNEIEEAVNNYETLKADNARLLQERDELFKALNNIANMTQSTGRVGCTYGDTDFDSLSVVYGYNNALDDAKDIATAAINKIKQQ